MKSPHVTIIHQNNMFALANIDSNSVQAIYIDPPYNTGKTQSLASQKTVTDAEGKRFVSKNVKNSYNDTFEDFKSFLYPRFQEAHRVLKEEGTLYVHMDWHEVHYAKVWLDEIFGRENFVNEIIWSYDYGAKSTKKFSAKHDNILVYAKNFKKQFFDIEKVDRIPYMAPGMVSPEKAKRGKLVTDVWWNTIVPTNGKEKTGYPTQKPRAIVLRALKTTVKPGDTVLDFFAGSGTTGDVAVELGAHCILVDENPQAINVMKNRFANIENININVVDK